MNKTEELRKVQDDVFALSGELADYRRQENTFAVFGEGSHDAEIVFIGEAPGKNEAKTGRPFCGAAGKILDELLESIQMAREEVYITNIVKDRPPDNRDPLPGEIELYAPFLDQQLTIIQPQTIATLGRFSMEYIMRRFDLSFELEPMSAAHGKVFEVKAPWSSVRIVPLYHPAASIYNHKLRDTLFKDIKVLKSS